MVKVTREAKPLRRSPRLTSSASPRLKEEEQVIFVSQTCSPGPMKGETSETVDPTGRPNSKFVVPSQQPALNLVASAATVLKALVDSFLVLPSLKNNLRA